MVSKASAFKAPHNEPTVRLTVSQAVVRFLASQYVERDGAVSYTHLTLPTNREV